MNPTTTFNSDPLSDLAFAALDGIGNVVNTIDTFRYNAGQTLMRAVSPILQLGTDYKTLIDYHAQKKAGLDTEDRLLWVTGNKTLPNFTASWKEEIKIRELKHSQTRYNYIGDPVDPRGKSRENLSTDVWSTSVFCENLLLKAGNAFKKWVGR